MANNEMAMRREHLSKTVNGCHVRLVFINHRTGLPEACVVYIDQQGVTTGLPGALQDMYFDCRLHFDENFGVWSLTMCTTRQPRLPSALRMARAGVAPTQFLDNTLDDSGHAQLTTAPSRVAFTFVTYPRRVAASPPFAAHHRHAALGLVVAAVTAMATLWWIR